MFHGEVVKFRDESAEHVHAELQREWPVWTAHQQRFGTPVVCVNCVSGKIVSVPLS